MSRLQGVTCRSESGRAVGVKFTVSTRERRREPGEGEQAFLLRRAPLGGVLRPPQPVRERGGSWWSSLRGRHGKEAGGGTSGETGQAGGPGSRFCPQHVGLAAPC